MQDILFRYPDSQNFMKFKKIRGLFLTLSDLMPSVTGTELKTYVHLSGFLNILYLTLHSNYLTLKCVLQSGSALHSILPFRFVWTNQIHKILVKR